MYGENRTLRAEYEIWLPTQSQLQKMILNHGQHGYNNSGILVGLSLFAEKNNLNEVSMEQLWLAFLMSEKYNKKWNNEKWEVKE